MADRFFIVGRDELSLVDYRDAIMWNIKTPLEFVLRTLENNVEKTTEDGECAMAIFTCIMKLWDFLEETATDEIEKRHKKNR